MKVIKVSAVCERLVQRYSEVFGLGAKGRVSLLNLTFSSRLASLFLRWKAADTVFVVLSFSFQVWRYSPTVVMSLLSTPSTVCQSPSACMISRSSVRRWQPLNGFISKNALRKFQRLNGSLWEGTLSLGGVMRQGRCCDRGNFPRTRLSGSRLSWQKLVKLDPGWCRRCIGERRHWVFRLDHIAVQGCWMLPRSPGSHRHEIFCCKPS